MYQPGGAPPDAIRAAALAEPLGGSTQPHLTGDSQFGQTRPSFAPTQSVVDELDLDLDDPEAGSPSTRGALDSRSPAARPISEVDAHKAPAGPAPASADAAKPKVAEPLAFDMAGFSLDLDPPTSPTKRSGEHALQGVDLPSLDLDADGDGDPMQRKLELAEEFRQIGDKDGARDLLREVLANASGVTKSKAQTMLDDLS
jgi:pilus assembly protein FimV